MKYLSSCLRSFSGAILLAAAASPAPAAQVLVVTPRASSGNRAIAVRVAFDLSRRLNSAGVQSALYDPKAPGVHDALRKTLLSNKEIDDPNAFDVAEQVGAVLGARYVVFGELADATGQPSLPGVVLPRLSLARIETSYVTLLVPPGHGAHNEAGSSADPADQIAADMAAAVLQAVTQVAIPHTEINSGESHWQEAQRLFRSGQVSNAVAELRQAIKAAPDNAGYQAALGSVLLQQGQTAEAAELYQDAVTAAPFDPDFRVGLARALLARGQNAAAMAALADASQLSAGRPATQVALGQLLLDLGQRDLAIRVLRLASEAGSAAAAAPLARALAADGDLSGAEAALRESLRTAPGNLSTRYQLASLLLRERQPRQAVTVLLEATRNASGLASFGAIVASTAVDDELSAVLAVVGGMDAVDAPSLQSRVADASRLIDEIPEKSANAPLRARRQAAVEDILQAIEVRRRPSGVAGAGGNVSVLVAQAKQLLGLSEAPAPATGPVRTSTGPAADRSSAPASAIPGATGP